MKILPTSKTDAELVSEFARVKAEAVKCECEWIGFTNHDFDLNTFRHLMKDCETGHLFKVPYGGNMESLIHPSLPLAIIGQGTNTKRIMK